MRDLVSEALDQLDERLLIGLYASVSVSTGGVQRWLRKADRPFLDAERDVRPLMPDVEHTASWVIDQSRFKATAVGGFAGFAGAISVPPEVAATLVASLRLGQRLAIVYGFDPETDRGQMALWRALAAGYEVELPEDGPIGFRVSQLPALLAQRAAPSAGGELASMIVRRSTWMVSSRFMRMLPFVSPGFSALAARRRMREIGGRMQALYRRLAEPQVIDPAGIEDAVEL